MRKKLSECTKICRCVAENLNQKQTNETKQETFLNKDHDYLKNQNKTSCGPGISS